MAVVLDASAATQIAMGSESGLALQSFFLYDEEVFAPDFLQLECANAFWKYVRAGELTMQEAQDYFNDSKALVTRFIRQNDLMSEVLLESARLKHPVYDVVYLVLARRLCATLATLDRRLQDLCTQQGIDCIEAAKL